VLAANGEHLSTEAFPNTHAGRARAIALAARRTSGDLDALWVIEGAGGYGAQLARQTAVAGYRVACFYRH
jgi:transposase